MNLLSFPWQTRSHSGAPHALAHYNYRLFLGGQLVSQSGGWMHRIAQAWLVLELTESPAALGTVVTLQFLPILLLALVLGTANAMEQPVRQAFPAELVGRDLIPQAVALNSAVHNVARIFGPAL